MKKVVIDAGHGGKDSGAIGNGMYEKNITLPVALKVGEILTQHKVIVNQTRTTDTFVELKDRAAKANKWGADAFVSIHCNAFDNPAAQGTETFSYTNSTRGTALAKSIHDNIIAKKLYTKNRGIKKANFLVLRETKMVAALTELAFITNQQDAALLKTKQNEFAAAIAKGILDFLGIKYQEATAPAKGTPITGSQIKINLLGRPITATGKLENGVNYLTVKGKDIPIRDIFEALNLQVGWENNTVIIK